MIIRNFKSIVMACLLLFQLALAQEVPPDVVGTVFYGFDQIDTGISAQYEVVGHDPHLPGLVFETAWYVRRVRTCTSLDGYSYVNPPSPPNILVGSGVLSFVNPVSSLDMRVSWNNDSPDSDMVVKAYDPDGILLESQSNFKSTEYVDCGDTGYNTDLSALGSKAIGPFTNGRKIARVEFEGSFGVIIDNLTVNHGSGQVKPDIRIDEFKIGQTVFDPDFLPGSIIPTNAADSQIGKDGIVDLVKGKSAVAYITGSVIPVGSISLVDLGLEVDGVTSNVDTFVDVDAQGRFIAIIPMNTDSEGTHSIRPIVDPFNAIDESNEANNHGPLKTYRTYGTAPLGIGISEIRGCTLPVICYDSPFPALIADFISSEQVQFLSDVFPVADSGQLTIETLPGISGTVSAQPFGSGSVSNGIILDLINLEIRRLLNNKRKTFGLFDRSYTSFHSSQGASGVSGKSAFVIYNGSMNVGLIDASDSVSLAHELGHLIGQGIDFYEGDNTLKVPAGVEWGGTGINSRTKELYSGKMPFMGPLQDNLSDLWVDRNTYYKAFNTLLRPELDPEIIILGGLLHKDGHFELSQFVESNSGLLTNGNNEGTIVVQTVRPNGSVINQVRYLAEFSMISMRKSGSGPLTLDMGVAPIVVSLPNSTEVARVQVISSGNVIFEKVVAKPPSTAQELVSKIPLVGMRGKAQAQRVAQRAALLKLATTADRLVAQKKFKAAVVLLIVLKIEIRLFVKDSYPVGDGEITKDQALEAADHLIRLATSKR